MIRQSLKTRVKDLCWQAFALLKCLRTKLPASSGGVFFFFFLWPILYFYLSGEALTMSLDEPERQHMVNKYKDYEVDTSSFFTRRGDIHVGFKIIKDGEKQRRLLIQD